MRTIGALMRIWIQLLMLGLFLIKPVSSMANCAPTHFKIDNSQVHRNYDTATNWCYLVLGPSNIDSFIYRNYMLTNEGLLFIFNSFGEGPSSTTTGARAFYFFPRLTQDISFQLNETKHELEVMLTNQKKIFFSTGTSNITNIENGSMSLDPQINPKNHGGLEITKYSGLYLDAGFSMGHSPVENLAASSVFYDSKGKSCKVKNQLIFEKKSENVSPRSDIEISKLLKKTCPHLLVEF